MSAGICVIGAGPSGIVTAKLLAERGMPYDVLEREDAVGGTWNYGSGASYLYESTHLITSITRTQFSDRPFPPGTADFPRHDQALRYLDDYVDHHDLRGSIRTGVEVKEATRLPRGASADPDARWLVRSGDGTETTYAGLIVANGHNNRPRMIDLPNDGTVEVRHTSTYKTLEELRGRRVLVVGGGNSGCDVVSDAATAAAEAHLSLRRGYYIFPKVAMGRPMDVLAELPHTLRLPLPARRVMGSLLLRSQIGRYTDYGLPKPDHKMYAGHLTLNSRLFYHLKHGDVTVHPDVRRVADGRVWFADDSSIAVDLVLLATGFEWDIPFLAKDTIGTHGDSHRPDLLLQVAHPRDPSLMLSGLVQTDTGIWPIAEQQSALALRLLLADRHRPDVLDWFRRVAPERMPQGQFLGSPRHRLEVEHAAYQRALVRASRDLDRRLGPDLAW